ncbi:MAG: hypothetical protein ACK56F_31670, partial [bacterium]
MSKGSNLSRTAAIDVLFSINSSDVFDLMYFRFRPSKAKSIGNFLTNRQNAVKRVQEILAGIFKKSMGARNQGRIG